MSQGHKRTKLGRNKITCQVYRDQHIREKNKLRKKIRHQKRVARQRRRKEEKVDVRTG